VANLELRGKGTFYDPRLDDAEKYPVAAANPELFGHKRDPVDRITPKLAALQFYQLGIPAPSPPAGSFDVAAAARGKTLFAQRAVGARSRGTSGLDRRGQVSTYSFGALGGFKASCQDLTPDSTCPRPGATVSGA
jgi:hypothetical protein